MKLSLSKVDFVNAVFIFGAQAQSIGAKPLVPSNPPRDIVLDTDAGIIIVDGLKGIPLSNVRGFDIMKVEPVAKK